jgi:hypothetical protein
LAFSLLDEFDRAKLADRLPLLEIGENVLLSLSYMRANNADGLPDIVLLHRLQETYVLSMSGDSSHGIVETVGSSL